MLHVAFAGRGQHRAGAEEQQALEQGVVEHVQQRGGQRQRCGKQHAVCLEGECKSETDEDDADVLDRMIGQQPFEIVLHQRIKHAHHGGRSGECEHDDAPPPGRSAGKIEHDAHEAVDGDFRHHAAHQCGDVARSSGVGERQPDVQRHEAGLRTRSDQRQDERQRAEHGRGMRRAHLCKRIEAFGPGKQAERQQQSHRPETRHNQIDVSGTHVFGHAMMRHH